MRASDRRRAAFRLASTAALLAAPLAGARADPGELLYARQCALCHGERGAADGPAAYLLFPPARDFTRGAFKLASTANGVPTDYDLIATLRRGMPGSAMPSWAWMDEGELRALAGHVRALAVEGIYEDLRYEHGDEVDPGPLMEEARARMEPGEPISVAPPAPRTDQALARGEALFLAHCASCHGEDGKGRHDVLRRDEDQTLNWARDFTQGVLKSGANPIELERRIRVGIHGTAMPAAGFAAADMAALVYYVQGLIAADSQDRLVQHRQVLHVRRVDEALPSGSNDPRWDEAEELDLVLAPLWWRDGAVLEARIAALHDGESIAVRVRWADETPDAPRDVEPPYDVPPYTDAVALQLSPLEHPPFFGMGAGAPRTDMWHWRAIDLPDARDLEAALRLVPHRLGEWITGGGLRDVPWYEAARGPLLVNGDSVAVEPAGMRTLEGQHALASSPEAAASWWAGEWEVVFTRPLRPAAGAGLPLFPGDRASFGLAVWNGANRDLRGQKSVTIWHALELEP
jgi:mono/diheme cytochrome c family protein